MRVFAGKLLSGIYQRVFHEEISADVWLFFKNLWYVALGYGIAGLCAFIFQLLAGKVLGPEEYGKYALVDSVAAFLYIPMILGTSVAMIKYNAERQDFAGQSKIISNTYFIVFALSSISVLLFFFFSPQLENLFSVPPTIFRLSIIFALLSTFYFLTTNTLRSLHQMKRLSIFQAVYGIILPLAFLSFFFVNIISFKAAVFAMYISFGVVAIIIGVSCHKYFSPSFDRQVANTLIRYGLFIALETLSIALLLSISKILINKYLTPADVGIYNAYYYASIILAGFFATIFQVVYFPTVSKYREKRGLFRKINRAIPYLFLLGVPALFVAQWVVLTLYGREYPIDYPLMLLFATTSILIISHALYMLTFQSQGIRGARLATLVVVIMGGTNVALSIYLIPTLRLYGAIGAVGIAYLIGLVCLMLLRRKVC